ncbi:hypothetical protein [Tabrizicola sp.]|uniref:hypothetical protein n=1 Tax=Tabrizicola sp. TaxID=2005166 RepID=UPI003F357BDC
MRLLASVVVVLSGLGSPALAEDCASLVKSMCGDAAGQEGSGTVDNTGRRVLTVEVKPPAYAIGDRFPVEERSLLMNPKRYGLPGTDGTWRYYAMDGVVYRVDNTSAKVIEVIRDSRTWRLR